MVSISCVTNVSVYCTESRTIKVSFCTITFSVIMFGFFFKARSTCHCAEHEEKKAAKNITLATPLNNGLAFGCFFFNSAYTFASFCTLSGLGLYGFFTDSNSCNCLGYDRDISRFLGPRYTRGISRGNNLNSPPPWFCTFPQYRVGVLPMNLTHP